MKSRSQQRTHRPSETNASSTDIINDIDKKRRELIRLSEDGELTQSVKFLRKSSAGVINKLHAEYEARRLEKVNAFLKDLAIDKFAGLLGGLDAISDAKELDDEL